MTLQQPLATGQVTHDSVTRSLLVKPAERAWAWLIWQRGHTALMQHDGSINGPRPVFARLGHGDVGRGEAVRDGWVRFKLSDADYRQLAGESDLGAIVTVDRGTSRLFGVALCGRL